MKRSIFFVRWSRVPQALAAWVVLVPLALPPQTAFSQRNEDRLDQILSSAPRIFRVPDAAVEAKDFLENGNSRVAPELRELARDSASKGLAALSQDAEAKGVGLIDDFVAVTLVPRDADDMAGLAEAVRAAGGALTISNPRGVGGALFANIPLTAIDKLGAADSLGYLAPQPMFKPTFQQSGRRIVSQGVETTKAVLLHQRGTKGGGVKVGILDFGFRGLQKLVASGALPEPKGAKAFNLSGSMETDSEHGTACAEIIHAMAPESELYLAAVNGSMAQILQAAEWLVSEKVDIISFSGGGHFGPHDGSSLLDTLVGRITERGILWVNAAGNEADGHWVASLQNRNAGGWLTLGANGENAMALRVKPGSPGAAIQMNWDDWGKNPMAPTATQDVDAFLFAYNPQTRETQLVAQSVWPQRGSGAPMEKLAVQAPSGTILLLALRATQVTRPVRLHVYTQGVDMFPHAAQGSIGIPATAPSALSVAAVHWQTDNLEPYSSQGPTDDGRMKPEVSAPSVVASASYPDRGFNGTSAACPHVSGFAALIKELNPSATGDVLKGLVVRAVRAKGSPTPNYGFGFGYIDGTKLSGGATTPPGPGRGGAANQITITLPPDWGGKVSPQALDELVAVGKSRSGRLEVKLSLGKQEYKIGDGMKIGVKVSEDAYYVLLHRDSSGHYTFIAPDGNDRNMLIGGSGYAFPADERNTIKVSGPAGEEEIVVIASRQPLDLNRFRSKAADGDGVVTARISYRVR